VGFLDRFKKKQKAIPLDRPHLEELSGQEIRLPEQVLWLHDAPLFIDEEQIDALYDAILAPDYEEGTRTISSSLTGDTKVGTEATVGLAMPGLVKGGLKVTGEAAVSGTRGREVSLVPVSNAYRRLLSLTIHYAVNWPQRMRMVAYSEEQGYTDLDARTEDHSERVSWLDPAFIGTAPRPLVLLELPPTTMFVPTALEVDGKVGTLYEKLGTALAREGETHQDTSPQRPAPMRENAIGSGLPQDSTTPRPCKSWRPPLRRALCPGSTIGFPWLNMRGAPCIFTSSLVRGTRPASSRTTSSSVASNTGFGWSER
jgi:hypothetical protein